jgi:hypothetical protein
MLPLAMGALFGRWPPVFDHIRPLGMAARANYALIGIVERSLIFCCGPGGKETVAPFSGHDGSGNIVFFVDDNGLGFLRHFPPPFRLRTFGY